MVYGDGRNGNWSLLSDISDATKWCDTICHGFLNYEPQTEVMKKLKILIAGFALLLMTTSAFADKHQEVAIGNEIPELVVRNDSTEVSLPSLRGKWVILSFWSASDAESRLSQNRVTSFTRAMDETSQAGQVELISVNFDRSAQLMREIIEIDRLDSEMQFHIENRDEIATLRKTFRMDNALRTFVINPQGKLAIADPTEDDLRQLLESAA